VASEVVAQLTGVTKRFGHTTALDKSDIDVSDARRTAKKRSP
jgi:hypothetical protein